MWIFLPKWICVVDFILKMKIALWGGGWSDSLHEDVDISPKMNVCCWFYSQNENSIVWMRMWIFLPKWICVVDFILKMKIALWGCGWSDSWMRMWIFLSKWMCVVDFMLKMKIALCEWGRGYFSQNEFVLLILFSKWKWHCGVLAGLIVWIRSIWVNTSENPSPTHKNHFPLSTGITRMLIRRSTLAMKAGHTSL